MRRQQLMTLSCCEACNRLGCFSRQARLWKNSTRCLRFVRCWSCFNGALQVGNPAIAWLVLVTFLASLKQRNPISSALYIYTMKFEQSETIIHHKRWDFSFFFRLHKKNYWRQENAIHARGFNTMKLIHSHRRWGFSFFDCIIKNCWRQRNNAYEHVMLSGAKWLYATIKFQFLF